MNKKLLIITILLIAVALLPGCTGSSPSAGVPLDKTVQGTPAQGAAVVQQETKAAVETLKFDMEPESETDGNSAGNIFYGGHLQEKDGWLYLGSYFYSDSVPGLYRERPDGMEKTKLNDDRALCINAVGDCIYYREDIPYDFKRDGDFIAGIGYINRVKPDGTGKTRVGENMASEFIVADNWIYYQNASDDKKLYRMKTDGTGDTRISDDNMKYVNVEDGWIYYYNSDETWSMYRMRTDGTGKERISDHNYGMLIVKDGWIYFLDDYDGDTLHRMKTDGTENTKLSDEEVYSFNVYGDWAYYSDTTQGSYGRLHMIKTDGTKKIDLKTDHAGLTINITGGSVYYEKDDGHFYKMNLDGTAETLFKF